MNVKSFRFEAATFWHGAPLSALDAACLASFVRAGASVTVYCFDEVKGLPDGVRVNDATAVVERRYLDEFKVLGRSSIPHFSDYFRYCMFQTTDAIWIDADVICRSTLEVPSGTNLIARESGTKLGNAVLRIDSSDQRLPNLISAAQGHSGKTGHAYGDTGPKLITQIYGHDADIQSASRFYPIPSHLWWTLFLPEYRAWCEARCANASAIHLWNNLITASGYWKELGPPRDCYLDSLLEELGLRHLFREQIPEAVMMQIATNYVQYRVGNHLTLKQLLRLATQKLSGRLRRGWRSVSEAGQRGLPDDVGDLFGESCIRRML